MNIAHIFDEASQRWPERVAIIDKDARQYTYAELRHLVMQQVKRYSEKGIKEGDRILVFIPMSVELYIAVLALFYTGATAVFLDTWVGKKNMEHCCRMAACKGFIASLKIRFLALQSAELRKIPHWMGLPLTKLRGKTPPFPMYPAQPGHSALITYTTGSTGMPKAANRTHAFLEAQFDALAHLTAPLSGHPSGPDMPMLPIVLLLNLGKGITSVIADFKATKPAEFKPGRIWRQIQSHEVVSITSSPYFAGRIAGSAPPGNTSLKRMIIGGSAVFPDLVSEIRNKLPGMGIHVVYGSTEAEPISHISGDEMLAFHSGQPPAKGLLTGYPDPSARVAIIPLDYEPGTKFEPLTIPGAIGEICVSGKHVLTAYLDNPEANRQNKIWVNSTCWHRTGDTGYLDDAGRLFLLGRCRQIIRHNGFTYYPFLAEYLLQSMPGITCGTVLLTGEQLAVVVQPHPGINRAETETDIRRIFPGASIIYLEEIPKDPRHFSKIDYEKLKNKVRPEMHA